ncbi:toprim domain-containing protein [Azospirillum doebereinerae]|uniref:DUF7146 domain-containing protein n=1 Tax=Azospirillum doebereinerae TaxID=92933 RepID=UPI001EE5E591|nr:toprim domain-containing protein [Azospirillum doebereinerae]MCG5240849.1 toprim domain-containing protein [Azospirillum doebereinerae]
MIDSTDLDDVRGRLRDHARALAETLLGPPNATWSGRNEIRFGRKGSLSLVLTGPKAGLWCEHGAEEGGDMLTLIARELRLDFLGSVRWATAWLGDPGRHDPPVRAAVSEPPPVEHATLSPWGRELWASARPVAPDCIAGRYLLGRRCALPESHAVRWVPSLRYGPAGTEFPALLGLITDVQDAGRLLNLHRTWLAPDGSGKAPVDRPRLLLRGHRKAGGVIRLSANDDVTVGLGIAEGLETALTALAAGWAPVWCCIDAGNLGAFPVLHGIESVTIFADYDPAGRAGADKVANRWAAAGREARIVLPPRPGDDLNDWAAA